MSNRGKNRNDANDVDGANGTNNLRVMVEIGLRGKRVVAVAPDWPGLERGATTEEAAIKRLLLYVHAMHRWRSWPGWRPSLRPA